MNDLVEYKKDEVELLRETVCRGATNAELAMFGNMCKATGLNPFKKEIWFIKSEKGGVQMMTGINGFLAIANKHPQFDGMEVSLEEKDGKLISATAKVYRKDRQHPSVATVYLQEYFKPSKTGYGMWEKMPRMMLQKVAKSVALREAFPQELNSLYTKEEMPIEYSEPRNQVPATTLAEKLEVIPEAEKEVVEPEEERKFVYNLSLLPEDKMKAAVAYATKEGLELDEVNGYFFVLSDKEIKKFSRCKSDYNTYIEEIDIESMRIEDDSEDNTL